MIDLYKKGETMEAKCSDCAFYVPNKDKHGTEGVCWRFPPLAYPFPVQGVVGAQPRIMTIVTRPNVQQDHFCGELMFKHKAEPSEN